MPRPVPLTLTLLAAAAIVVPGCGSGGGSGAGDAESLAVYKSAAALSAAQRAAALNLVPQPHSLDGQYIHTPSGCKITEVAVLPHASDSYEGNPDVAFDPTDSVAVTVGGNVSPDDASCVQTMTDQLLDFSAAGAPAATGTASTPDPEAAAKAAFVSEADAVCGRHQPVLDADSLKLGDFGNRPLTPADRTRFVPLIAKTQADFESFLDELHLVQVPVADQPLIGGLIDSFSAKAQLLGELGDAVEAGDRKRVNDILGQFNVSPQAVAAVVNRFAFRVCGNG
jgi:hypothetical protein